MATSVCVIKKFSISLQKIKIHLLSGLIFFVWNKKKHGIIRRRTKFFWFVILYFCVIFWTRYVCELWDGMKIVESFEVELVIDFFELSNLIFIFEVSSSSKKNLKKSYQSKSFKIYLIMLLKITFSLKKLSSTSLWFNFITPKNILFFFSPSNIIVHRNNARKTWL